MIEERHRRLHRRARRINFIAVPTALVGIVGWLYLRLFVCWQHRLTEAGALLCGYSALMPMLLGISIAVGIALLARELHLLGRELLERVASPAGGKAAASSSRRTAPPLVHGMRSLTPAHRRHVWTAVVLVVALVAFELWLFSRFEVVMPG